MEKHLQQLREERERAAREFLAIEGWACSKAEINAAVIEIMSGSKLATSSLAFLLRQISHVSARAEPARRLNDLTRAIAAVNAMTPRNPFVDREPLPRPR